MRYRLAEMLCRTGQWFVEKGIEVAGSGKAEVEFAVDDFEALPLWVQVIGAVVVTLGGLGFLVVFFAATGVK